jgi:homoserine kinase type II
MATFTPLSIADAQRITDAHGLGAPTRVIGVSAGTVNSNYFIETAGGRVFVRLYEQQETDGVAYEWQLLDHLAERGVKVPPRVRGPGPGELRVAGRPVAVFHAVAGEDLCQALVTPARARAVGGALAAASRAGEDFAVERAGRFTLANVAQLHDVAEAAGRPELAPVLARLRALHSELVEAEAGPLAALPRGVIHGDLFRDNVLWQGTELSALLDWESASSGVVVYDLAVTLLAWCCSDALDFELARAMVEGYLAVRPLQDAEWDGLWWSMRKACLRFATTRITDIYLKPGFREGYKHYKRFLMRLDTVEAESPSTLRARLTV